MSTSARWNNEGTWLISNFPLAICSRTKYKSISMCFVRECWIGLADSEIVIILSHQIVGFLGLSIWSSRSSDWIHKSSVAVLATDLYSTSILERETVGCFLEHHDTGFGPIKMQQSVVDLRSSWSEAQSASLKACMCELKICSMAENLMINECKWICTQWSMKMQ